MAKRQLPGEFKEFVQCLNSNDVRYLLVGGWAVGMYGHPRATKDIDFLVAIDDGNLCYPRKETIKADNIDVFVISMDDLIKNKRASGRSMDIADAERLERQKLRR